MRHRNKKNILNRNASYKNALVKNLAASLILYESVKTTAAKARVLKDYTEKLITRAKDNTLTTSRKLLKKLPTKNAVNKLLEVIAPKFKNKRGGCIRINKLTHRKGDGASLVLVEFIEKFEEISDSKLAKKIIKHAEKDGKN